MRLYISLDCSVNEGNEGKESKESKESEAEAQGCVSGLSTLDSKLLDTAPVRLRFWERIWFAIVACAGTLLTASAAAEPLLSDTHTHRPHGMIPVRALAFPVIILVMLYAMIAERIRKAKKRRRK